MPPGPFTPLSPPSARRYSPPEPGALAVSALHGLGLPQLKARLEAAVLAATGRQLRTLRVPLAGPQLRWATQPAGGRLRREGP